MSKVTRVDVRLVTTHDPDAVREFMTSTDIWPTFTDDLSIKSEYQPEFSSRCMWLNMIIHDEVAGVVLVENEGGSSLRIHPYMLKASRKYIRCFFDRFFIMFMKTPEFINKLVVTIPTHRRIVYNTAKKVGFIDEGLRRGSFLKNGEFIDQWDLGLTKREIEAFL